jgi:hypothetical protein
LGVSGGRERVREKSKTFHYNLTFPLLS